MNIELTPEQQAAIEKGVKAGNYDSPAAMIERALIVLDFFDREIQPSLDELDRGEGTPPNMDEIIAEANQDAGPRVGGFWAGKVQMSDSWENMDSEVEALFEASLARSDNPS